MLPEVPPVPDTDLEAYRVLIDKRFANPSIGDTIRQYCDTFGHIHVADAPGRHEPGTGEINYAYVFRALEENGYDGVIGFELFPKTSTAEAVKAIMAVN